MVLKIYASPIAKGAKLAKLDFKLHRLRVCKPTELWIRSADNQSDQNRPKFVAVTSLEDVQAVRCAEFHPNGRNYAVGSNSKTFRICEYPPLSEIRCVTVVHVPTVRWFLTQKRRLTAKQNATPHHRLANQIRNISELMVISCYSKALR
ncbi:conserved hypothetical protein [Culex quinquefasciatus]|uniref:Uncharacterized protein n=1 Tax=Culex quinquefasciatus TaxID=7176 RepID=B0WHM2_CULQU|nr:conserved hypothetical protein [Culex quinquefasciatus]|eukprot:XP_001848206.1 conserved hypothetical protein [Culex quinquefasciatus]